MIPDGAVEGVPDAVLNELRLLLDMSSRVVGNTRPDDPARTAGDDFCKLALQAMRDYGISARKLSALLGKSATTVQLRLARRGYTTRPTTVKPYDGSGRGSNTGKGKNQRKACE